MPVELEERVKNMNIPLLGTIPSDQELMSFEFSGRPLIELGEGSPVYKAVAEMMDKILN
jgi:CO dehydrogenase nickel-insertion accessory protein CooC1